MSNNSFGATGGSGAYIELVFTLKKSGIYTLDVGSGGTGSGSTIGGTPSYHTDGVASTFKSQDGTLIFSAGGGTAGISTWSGLTSGSAGVVNNPAPSTLVSVNDEAVILPGNNGASFWQENSGTIQGATIQQPGYTAGSSGWANGNPGGGNVGPAYHGYGYLEFLSYIK